MQLTHQKEKKDENLLKNREKNLDTLTQIKHSKTEKIYYENPNKKLKKGNQTRKTNEPPDFEADSVLVGATSLSWS